MFSRSRKKEELGELLRPALPAINVLPSACTAVAVTPYPTGPNPAGSNSLPPVPKVGSRSPALNRVRRSSASRAVRIALAEQRVRTGRILMAAPRKTGCRYGRIAGTKVALRVGLGVGSRCTSLRPAAARGASAFRTPSLIAAALRDGRLRFILRTSGPRRQEAIGWNPSD